MPHLILPATVVSAKDFVCVLREDSRPCGVYWRKKTWMARNPPREIIAGTGDEVPRGGLPAHSLEM